MIARENLCALRVSHALGTAVKRKLASVHSIEKLRYITVEVGPSSVNDSILPSMP